MVNLMVNSCIYHVVPLMDAYDSVPHPYEKVHFAVDDEAAHSLAFVASYVPVDLELQGIFVSISI